MGGPGGGQGQRWGSLRDSPWEPQLPSCSQHLGVGGGTLLQKPSCTAGLWSTGLACPGGLGAAGAEGGASGLGDPQGARETPTVQSVSTQGLWRLDPKLFFFVNCQVRQPHFFLIGDRKKGHIPRNSLIRDFRAGTGRGWGRSGLAGGTLLSGRASDMYRKALSLCFKQCFCPRRFSFGQCLCSP